MGRRRRLGKVGERATAALRQVNLPLRQLLTLSIYWLGINTIWAGFNTIVLPARLLAHRTGAVRRR